jgi:signal transduction histidine kinase
LLDRLCALTAGLLGCDFVQIRLWRPEQDSYCLVASFGSPHPEAAEAPYDSVGRSQLAGLLARIERDGVASVEECAVGGTSPLAGGLHTGLRASGTITGILSAGFAGGRGRFGPRESDLARGVADLASLALEHSRFIERLELANATKLDFLASMSHELRTPLHVIIGYNDLLRERAFGPLDAEQVDVLERVSDRAREVLALTESTLEISRIEAGPQALHPEEVDLEELVDDVLAEVAARRPANVTIETDVRSTLPRLFTDRARVRTVVGNLVENALRFTERGRVRIILEQLGGGIECSVVDTGRGIAPEDRLSVFDPFWRGDNLGERKDEGVGLGLYMARRIVDGLGGSMTVTSALGQGSTFRFWLPPSPPGIRLGYGA